MCSPKKPSNLLYDKFDSRFVECWLRVLDIQDIQLQRLVVVVIHRTAQGKINSTFLIWERKSLLPTKRYWLTLGVPERSPIMLMKRLPGASRSIREAVISRLYLWDKSPGRVSMSAWPIRANVWLFAVKEKYSTLFFTPTVVGRWRRRQIGH